MMKVMIMLLVMVDNDDANGDDFNNSDDNDYDYDDNSGDDAGQFAGWEAADCDLHGGGPGQRRRGGWHIPGTHSLPALYIWLSISEISFLTTLYKSLIHSD